MSRPRRDRGRARGPRPLPPKPIEEVAITHVGQQGDGEGRLADGTRVFVPLTMAGDLARVRPLAKRGEGYAAELVELVDAKDRKEPVCPVFGRCGGCQLQHLPDMDYAAWKVASVVTALKRHGLDVPFAPLRQVPLQSRRRATLAAVMTQAGPVLGFNEAHSDRVIGIDDCPLLVAPLARLLAPIKTLLAAILPAPGRADVAMTAAGDDAVEIVIISEQKLDLNMREALAAFADTWDLARLAWEKPGETPEPVAARRDVTLTLGDVRIPLPMKGFLQPSKDGEAILRELVFAGVAGAMNVADLYCGIGTFTFPLASERRHVLAVDGIAVQLAAIDLAAGRHALGGRIRTQVRDLKEVPLSIAELADFDAVIFDPPRAGAKTQVEELARSSVAMVVAVSCNPATMGRDLRVLVDGGYEIVSFTPVDQFPMSHHVEAVAVLKRPG